MKNKTMAALVGSIAITIGVGLVSADECQNMGIVTGHHACTQVDECSNHHSQESCTSAKTWEYFKNTGTVEDHYINIDNLVCTTDVSCYWDEGCNVTEDGDGDTHNALGPDDGGSCSQG